MECYCVNKKRGKKFLKLPLHDIRPALGLGLGSSRNGRIRLYCAATSPHSHCFLFFFQNTAKVQANNVVVPNNPSPFYNPFQFEITFECIEDLSEGESRPPARAGLSVAGRGR